VVPFDAIVTVPCLVLLGEPGIGKTSTLESQRPAITREIRSLGGETLWLNLRSFGSEDRLIRNLFETPEFLAWRQSHLPFHLFLDSLDECLLRIDTVAGLLVDEFRKFGADNLFLRISCRTADWPASLQNGLCDIWGNDRIRTYELVPLRRKDVALAAEGSGVAVSEFMDEVHRREAVPLAIKPLTLKFLLNSFRERAGFPSSRSALFAEGCRILCEEPNMDRRAVSRVRIPSAERRLAIAERVAAITVFANRDAIWTGIDLGDVPSEDVTVTDLARGGDTISEAAMRETLDTGLFSSRGSNRMGWAHLTYAEFLAAKHVVRHKAPTAQVMNLLVHPYDPDKRIVPQLREVAAWIAGMEPSVFRVILQTDPVVLLGSDVATADDREREDLVTALLETYERDLAWDGRPSRPVLSKLCHPRIGPQLGQYIRNKTLSDRLRGLAIQIAESCNARDAQDELLTLAFDSSEPPTLRTAAVSALGDLTDENVRRGFLSILTPEVDDSLRAAVLFGVWPAVVGIDELLPLLTEPKENNHYGPYEHFLTDYLARYLRPEHLVSALNWAVRWLAAKKDRGPFVDLIDKILHQSWEHVDFPGVRVALAEAVLARLREHDGIFVGKLSSAEIGRTLDAEHRHSLLEAMIPYCTEPTADAAALFHSNVDVLHPDDIWWLLSRLAGTTSPVERETVATLIRLAWNMNDPKQTEAIYDTAAMIPELGNMVRAYFRAIDLDSDGARQMRELHRRRQQRNGQQATLTVIEPPPAERVAQSLRACESGDGTAWWPLTQGLSLELTSQVNGSDLEPDLTTLPGWLMADVDTRIRILNAAEKYLHAYTPRVEEWVGSGHLSLPDLAGYRALRLLQSEVPDVLSSFPLALWERWAPILLAFPLTNNEDKVTDHQALLRLAHERTPERLYGALSSVIDDQCRRFGTPFIVEQAEAFWDRNVEQLFLAKLDEETIPTSCFEPILEMLLRHSDRDAGMVHFKRLTC
jgi:hypothetical protein